jgi:hypothetical protein
MSFKLQKDECLSGEYLLRRQNKDWEVKVLSDGTIFIRLDHVCATFESFYFNINYQRYIY